MSIEKMAELESRVALGKSKKEWEIKEGGLYIYKFVPISEQSNNQQIIVYFPGTASTANATHIDTAIATQLSEHCNMAVFLVFPPLLPKIFFGLVKKKTVIEVWKEK